MNNNFYTAIYLVFVFIVMVTSVMIVQLSKDLQEDKEFRNRFDAMSEEEREEVRRKAREWKEKNKKADFWSWVRIICYNVIAIGALIYYIISLIIKKV